MKSALAVTAVLAIFPDCSGWQAPFGFSGLPTNQKPSEGRSSAHGSRGWPAPPILFVAASFSGSAVLMYDPDKQNPSPEASITTGIDDPSGLAVDRNGTLYVANGGNDTITVYPRGQTSPSFTISSGLHEPRGLAVDSNREIFAIDTPNDGTSSLVGYKPGNDSPFETVDLSTYGSCEDLAADGKDNLWLTCSGTKAVYEIRTNTSTLQNAKLEGLKYPSGISFGKNDLMYVSDIRSNDAGYIRLYPYGTRSPLGTINAKGTPALSCVTRSGAFFVIEASWDIDFVTGYKYGSRKPFSAFDEARIGYPFLLAVACTP